MFNLLGVMDTILMNYLLALSNNIQKQLLSVTQENGQLIPVKSAGGDGPIESAVNFYALQNNSQVLTDLRSDFPYNTPYNCHWLTSIEVS